MSKTDKKHKAEKKVNAENAESKKNAEQAAADIMATVKTSSNADVVKMLLSKKLQFNRLGELPKNRAFDIWAKTKIGEVYTPGEIRKHFGAALGKSGVQVTEYVSWAKRENGAGAQPCPFGIRLRQVGANKYKIEARENNKYEKWCK